MREPRISLAIFSLLAACGGRPDVWDESRAVMGPVPLGDHIAYVDGVLDRVVVIDGAGAPSASVFSVGSNPVYAIPVPATADGGEHLAVLTAGQEAIYEGERDEPPALYLVAVEEPGEAPLRYQLESPFDRLAVSSDGRTAIAFFSSTAVGDDFLFRNPNELAVVDLEAAPSDDNPVFRTVRSFSEAPTGVLLSPAMRLPGAPDTALRTFAFVLAPGTVTIFDADHPTRREVTVRLEEGDTELIPEELVFAPDAGAVWVRASSARDVLAILLSYEEPSALIEDDNDFQPALTELGAGGTPADLAVYDEAGTGKRRVLAATPGRRELTVIDTETAEYQILPTSDPVDRILLLPEASPRVAVLAAIASRSPRLYLLDLATVGSETLRPAMTTIEVSEPVFDVVPVPHRVEYREQVLVVHDDARTVLGVLNVVDRTVAPLEGLGRLDTYDFTSCGSSCGSFLVGASRSVPRLGLVDLDTLHPRDVRLDSLPAYVFALPSGALFVDHGDALGRATLLPGPDAERGDAVVFSGFLVADLLE